MNFFFILARWTYRVSRKKVYPFAANLVNIKYKDFAHLNYTIG